MPDSRIERYARLLVEECVDVQPGWQVVVSSTPLARRLVEEVVRCIARRGAYVQQRLDFGTLVGTPLAWLEAASPELAGELPDIDRYALEQVDAAIQILAPENTREVTTVPADRLAAINAAYKPFIDRFATNTLAWVGCQYPTPALAQEAGMGTREFEDFFYAACLLDWDAERKRMQRVADRFDAADQVRIVGAETDLTLSLAGRNGHVDAGGANIPGGEVFYSPVEDSAEGSISFTEFVAAYEGRLLTGIRLRFEAGRVVEASADGNEAYLLDVLDRDDGARCVGELGFGCNPGIDRYLRNTLFDEKMDGTVHLALGRGFSFLGGTNESAIHWDIVKDLRSGGRIEADGDVVQSEGRWQI
jgi:aminopeptidase